MQPMIPPPTQPAPTQPGAPETPMTGTTVDPRLSLAVTDKAILANFSLRRTLEQLAAQSGPGGFTSVQLFRQLWDTQNPAPGQADLNAISPGAHCTDNGGTLNTYPYVCRTLEGGQAAANSSTTIDSYQAVGLYNRFDLAPADGADCGEYRIVYAKTNASSGRNFLIFEAVLPNPRVDLGLEGCRPVAQFWADLTLDTSEASRSTKLQNFYYTGLPGFAPVVHMNHFGNTSRGVGQVRTNQFMGSPWMLREFKLKRVATATGNTLKFSPVTVKTNPFGELFNPASPHPQAANFRNHFLTQVASLAVNNLNTFNYTVPDVFNSGQSDAQSTLVPDDYVARFGSGSSAFRSDIQEKLNNINSTLTPEHIVERAQALSCGGCHQRSNERVLGGGLTWPRSAGFVHSLESSDPANTARFDISPALKTVFLPHRKGVLENYLNTPVRDAVFVSQSVPTRVAQGTLFTATVTMRNTGTTAWTAANSFRLGSQSPQDNTVWGTHRVMLAATDKVHQNQQKSFTFNLTAPVTPGFYTFQWRMVQDGVAWFGAFSPAVRIEVYDPCYCPPKQVCPDVQCPLGGVQGSASR